MILIKGDTGSDIYFDEVEQRWTLRKEGDLVMNSEIESFDAFGLRTMNWNKLKDLCKKKLNEVETLLITVCSVSISVFVVH